MNLVLDRMPEVSLLSPKVLSTLGRKPARDTEVPRVSAEVTATRFDPSRLAAYREICGFEGTAVPIPYPQVHAVNLQLHLFTQPQFPLPLMGMVHIRNTIRQQRELGEDETFDAKVSVIGHRSTDKGLEFDIETAFAESSGAVVWRSVATALVRGKAAHRPKRPPPPPPPAHLGQYHVLDLPEDIGRRYGRVSGDMNPIHLYPLTAKALGFERHIAHGMYTMARSAALLLPELGRAPIQLDTQFRQPLFLPSRASLRYRKAGETLGFSLIGVRSGKLHLEGSVS